MDVNEILKKIDHTLLRQDAAWNQVRDLCDEGIKYGVAAVCIAPAHVKQAAQYLGALVPVCTVIGFPNGYSTTASKAFEAADAVESGADELDMVINIGMLKECMYLQLRQEIDQVKAACSGRVLKVIIETCLLTDEEKVAICSIISDSGADFVKTSTGFSTRGAVKSDIALIRESVAPHIKIKASGGIKTLADAADFIALGADRIGTSSTAAIAARGAL